MADIDLIFKLKREIPQPPVFPPVPVIPVPLINFLIQLVSISVVNLFYDDIGSTADNYDIEYSIDPTFLTGVTSNTIASNPQSANNLYNITGLALGTQTYFRMRATNAVGPSVWVTDSVIIPLPGVIVNLKAQTLSTSSIKLTWDDPSPWAITYDLHYTDSATGFTTPPTVVSLPANPGGGTVETVITLLSSTLYHFRVRAVNSIGVSAWMYIDKPTL